MLNSVALDTAGANQNLKLLANAVANEGPVSICLNAQVWNDYTGGVLTAAGCDGMAAYDVDHCVQLVGYNTTAETPYWIVRNSWSQSWGLEGFIHLEYDQNTCGLADEATIATMASSPSAKVAAKKARFEQLKLRAQGAAEPKRSAVVV